MHTHFIALVGLDYDTDLLPYWVDYYREYGFDEYRVWLHVNGDEEAHPDPRRVRYGELFRDNGFYVEQAYGEFANGALRMRCLKGYQRTLPDDDFVICADSDEFQILSKDDYFDLMKCGFEVISGELRDRFDFTLHNPEPLIFGDPVRMPLHVQYPLHGNVAQIAKQTVEPASCCRAKVLAAKASVNVSYIGSHRVSGSKHREAKGYIVDHYTCRESYLRRMGGKTYFRPEQILDTASLFGITDPSDPRISWVYERIEQEAHSRGWEAGANGAVLSSRG